LVPETLPGLAAQKTDAEHDIKPLEVNLIREKPQTIPLQRFRRNPAAEPLKSKVNQEFSDSYL
jgi:hypothetical protein